MNKTVLFAFAALIAATSSAPAQSQKQNIRAAALEAVRAGLVSPFCGPGHVVDRGAADELAFQVSQKSERLYGELEFKRERKAAQRVILREMQEGGASLWCAKQRLFYEMLGVSGIIGPSLY